MPQAPRHTGHAHYRQELARVHDEGFGFLAEDAARCLISLLGSAARGLRLVDLGCGSGILAQRMARAGMHVTGVDGEPGARRAVWQSRSKGSITCRTPRGLRAAPRPLPPSLTLKAPLLRFR